MRANPPKLVLIEWIDSSGGCGRWEDRDDAARVLPATCITVGFLIAEGPSHKTVAASLVDDGDGVVGNSLTIPTFAIQKVRRLRLPQGVK